MDKFYRSIIFGIIFSLILSACSVSTANVSPTLTLEAAVTDTPAPSDDWSRVKSTSVLKVGTSADYPPFSYFDNNGQLDGFDIALIRELARRLGITAQINDFAFNSLADALFVNQIDAAVAAISITPDRANYVDFTNLYYSGTDGILARADSSITTVTAAEDLAGLRVAVQDGTVYETWVQDNLITPGLISLDQLYVYDKPEFAIRDLEESRVDIIILDLLPAKTAVSEGVKLVGQGLIPQQFAIAVRKGSTIAAELNRALAEAQSDGTISKLAETYLNVEPTVAIQTPPVVSPMQVYSTPVPPACVYGMAYVADLNYADNNMSNPPILKPGEAFTKGWRVRNTGTCDWDPTFFLTYVRGNVPAAQMNGSPTPVPAVVSPGFEVEIWVNLIAPVTPGTYQGFWQMMAPDGNYFGQTIWVGITVPGAAPTPAAGQPFIASFIASPINIVVGQCTSLSWSVVGTISMVELKRDNIKLWTNAPFFGNFTDCLGAAGIYTYALTANGPGGSTLARAQVSVSSYQPPLPNYPVIFEFRVNQNVIVIGQCVTLFWNTGNASVVELNRNGLQITNRLPASGSWSDCPTTIGTVFYELNARNSTGSVQSDLSIYVAGA